MQPNLSSSPWRALGRLFLPVLCLAVVSVARAQTTFAYHGVDGAAHQAHFDSLSKQGYRMIALTAYGTVGSPLYAAVWIQRPGPNFIGFHGLDAAAYQQLVDDNARTHTPRLLTAVGSAADPRFSGVFEEASHGMWARHGITWDELRSELGDVAEQVWRIATIDVYGDAGDPRFVVAFEPNTVDKHGWGVYDAAGSAEHTEKFNAMTFGWARPISVGLNDHAHFVALWRDTDVGNWAAHHGMSPSEYDAKAQAYSRQGWYPINLHASGSGGSAEFAAIFAATDIPSGRKWSTTGQTVRELSAFDDWAKAYMQSTGTRGAALAVVKDGRLVLARGYNWAEPGYPQTKPESLFRIASLNKPLTSIAIHQEMQQQPQAIGYASSMASFFGNPVFADPRSNLITVRHLLTHQGGWDRDQDTGSGIDPMFYDTVIAPALGINLPIDVNDIRTYMQGQPLDFTPGTESQYSNYGYSLLGRILEVLHPGKSYDQVMQEQLFAPLGINRAVIGGATAAAQLPGEVRYHPRICSVARSVVSASQPWVTRRYGDWNQANLDAHGGYVLAAPDFAKVLASFDLGNQNPVLNQAQATSMWTPEPSGWPKGWFLTSLDDGMGGLVDAYFHEGYLQGSVTSMARRADGISFVFLTNGDNDCGTPSLSRWNSVANGIATWPAHDLFPQVGIPSLKYQPGSVQPYGNSCAWTGGTPGLSYTGAAETGAQINMVLTQAPPATPAYFLLGSQVQISMAPWQSPLCTLYVMPAVVLPVPVNGLGTTSLPLALPNSSVFIGANWAAQYLMIDPMATVNALVSTNGLAMTIGGWSGF